MREIFNEPNSKSLGFGCDACIIFNNKFIITEWNKGDEQLLVWKASEVIGQNVRALAKKHKFSEVPDFTSIDDSQKVQSNWTTLLPKAEFSTKVRLLLTEGLFISRRKPPAPEPGVGRSNKRTHLTSRKGAYGGK